MVEETCHASVHSMLPDTFGSLLDVSARNRMHFNLNKCAIMAISVVKNDLDPCVLELDDVLNQQTDTVKLLGCLYKRI